MIRVPHFVRVEGNPTDEWHLSQDDIVALCGESLDTRPYGGLRRTLRRTVMTDPNPSCRACRIAFEARWGS